MIDEHGKGKGDLVPANPLLDCITSKVQITFFIDQISLKICFHIREIERDRNQG